MDPAAIIGLAWTAVQMVQVGLKATSTLIEVQREASTAELEDLIRPAESVVNALETLDGAKSDAASDELNTLGNELQTLTRKIISIISELKIELQKAAGRPRRKWWMAPLQLCNITIRWPRIKALREKIMEYQQALQTGLLVRTRYVPIPIPGAVVKMPASQYRKTNLHFSIKVLYTMSERTSRLYPLPVLTPKSKTLQNGFHEESC